MKALIAALTGLSLIALNANMLLDAGEQAEKDAVKVMEYHNERTAILNDYIKHRLDGKFEYKRKEE